MGTKIRIEKSTSRRSLHARVSTYLAISRDCSKITPQVLDKVKARPTYAKGEAYDVLVKVPPETFLVVLDLRRNPNKKVKGDMAVYDSSNTVILRAVYRKLKIRAVECYIDQELAYSIVKCVANILKLPVKRYGLSRCKI